MTAIVGIRCSNGVVIGSDSSATFGDGATVRTMEQPTDRKICIVSDQVIVAGTGYVGHMQRFEAVTKTLWVEKAFARRTAVESGKALSSAGIKDFQQTHLQRIDFSALVAFVANDAPELCELPGGAGNFQPEIKKVDDLWFSSAGSGQTITDPFLALIRRVFWPQGAPSLPGGIFTAMWALQHACEINPGGIKEPIKIAVLGRENGRWQTRMLDEAALAEHQNIVSEATKHLAAFKDVLEGRGAPQETPPKF